MIYHIKRTFVTTNPLNDYTLPLVSLVSGRKVSRLLRQEFGTVHIEDLVLPYFCVSANLTTGHSAVHRGGELWRWQEAFELQAYDQPFPGSAMETIYDLINNRYLAQAMNNEDNETSQENFDPSYFDPANVQKQATK